MFSSRTGRSAVLLGLLGLTVGLLANGATAASQQHGQIRFETFDPPKGFQTADALGRTNAGEPSVGYNPKSGAILTMAGTQVSKLALSDGYPAKATWTDVTPSEQGVVNEDAILFTDQTTGRTWSSGLLVAGSEGTYTDDDGKTWQSNQGFPEPHGPDHQTLGAGPYTEGKPVTALYPHAVYYCSQNIVSPAGAFCGRSDDGGLTYNVSSPLFGAASPCGALHGHVKVSPRGYVYVPQNSCTRKDGKKGQGMAISADNGQSWTYGVVPDSLAKSSNSDPSIGIGARDTVYYGYADGSGHPKVAVSHDHGKTWNSSVDVGVSKNIQNTEFPEVVAGDDNRAAFSYLGTTDDANDQSASFRGNWYVFVSYTYDGGKHWTTVNATPGHPVQRGCIWNGGGSNPCRNLLDFNDATVDRYGRVLTAYTDGCKDIAYSYASLAGGPQGSVHGPSKCESNPNSFKDTDKVAFLAVTRQACGPGLYEKYDAMLTSRC
jgi:hypothetical protein